MADMSDQQPSPSVAQMVHDALEMTRYGYGQPPRQLSWFKSFGLRPHRPPYLARDNRRLSQVYYDYRHLLRQGRLAWAQLVQANELLFKPGPHDHPAALVYRSLPCPADEGVRLVAAAEYLYYLKTHPTEAPAGLAQLAAAIADEMTVIYHYRLPADGRWNDPPFYTTIMVCRKHLPGGVLAQSFFPLLVDTPRHEAAMILPSQYWAPQLLSLWRINSF